MVTIDKMLHPSGFPYKKARLTGPLFYVIPHTM